MTMRLARTAVPGSSRGPRLICALIALMLIGSTETRVAWSETSAMAEVKLAVDQALAIVSDPKYKSAHASENEKLLALLDAYFDFRAMGRSSLGVNWNKLSPAQRERFEAAFQKYLERRYINIMESYSGQKIAFVKEQSDGDHAEVYTNVTNPLLQSPIQFDYMMKREQGKWKVYDMVIAEISEVGSYRDDFGKTLKSGGFDALMTKLATG